MMRSDSSVKKLAVAAILVAVAVVGSMFSFPVLASRSAPGKNMGNNHCWPSRAACAAPCCAA